MKTIGNNILKAIGIAGYFFVLMLAYQKMNTDRLIGDIEVFSGMFLVLGIIMLEVAYKKDSGKSAISAIELLVLAMYSLSIMHVIKFLKYDFNMYLMISAVVFAGYYVLKAIIENTIEKRKSLKQLSDISEIVKEEPIKKEAKRKNENVDEDNEKQKKTENKNLENNKSQSKIKNNHKKLDNDVDVSSQKTKLNNTKKDKKSKNEKINSIQIKQKFAKNKVRNNSKNKTTKSKKENNSNN